jgi:hypothetical protein
MLALLEERERAEYLTGQVFETSPDGISIVGRDYRFQRAWRRRRTAPAADTDPRRCRLINLVMAVSDHLLDNLASK